MSVNTQGAYSIKCNKNDQATSASSYRYFYRVYKKETSIQDAADTSEHVHYDNIGTRNKQAFLTISRLFRQGLMEKRKLN
jgi:hypothetical protein